jgi:hypothetical protein
MKKFILLSIVLNVSAIFLLTLFVILPRWYFGLGSGPQLFMEISIPTIIIIQISAAFVQSKNFNRNFIIGILPIIIPIWYYFYVVRPSIIAYM